MVTLRELKEILISRYYVREDSIKEISLARLLVESHEAGHADNYEDMCSFLDDINPHVYRLQHQFTEDTEEDLRDLLENMACAIDTSEITDQKLDRIKRTMLDSIFEVYNVLEDWTDAAICKGWSELERWAIVLGGKYYEDLVCEDEEEN